MVETSLHGIVDVVLGAAAFIMMVQDESNRNASRTSHVPVTIVPIPWPRIQIFAFRISLGKEVAQPKTTEHHIRAVNQSGSGSA